MNLQSFVRDLITLSERKEKVLQVMLKLTRQQSDEIQGENFEELSVLIQQKQQCIDTVDKCDRQIAKLRDTIKKNLNIAHFDQIYTMTSLPGAENLQFLEQKIQKIFKHIQQIDIKNNQNIQMKLSSVKKELKKIEKTKKMNNGYSGNKAFYNDGIFINRKG